MHLRIFKQSVTSSGGYLAAEDADHTQRLCNFAPEQFTLLTSFVLAQSYGFFVPTHTFVASNEADPFRLSQYLTGYPGTRMNPYTPAHYDAAVTVEESTVALQSVLAEALLCAWAEFFIGNTCSTMSQYIYHLRSSLGWTMQPPSPLRMDPTRGAAGEGAASGAPRGM